MLEPKLRDDYRALIECDSESYEAKIVKAADKLAAYIKCLEELRAGNREFAKAEKALRTDIEKYFVYPEVKYFFDKYVGSFKKTLDELEDK